MKFIKYPFLGVVGLLIILLIVLIVHVIVGWFIEGLVNIYSFNKILGISLDTILILAIVFGLGKLINKAIKH